MAFQDYFARLVHSRCELHFRSLKYTEEEVREWCVPRLPEGGVENGLPTVTKMKELIDLWLSKNHLESGLTVDKLLGNRYDSV